MRNFNDFNEETTTKSNSPMEMLKSLAKKYEGASESDMISAILKEAEKGKRNGTLTNQDIDNFVKAIRPMLNSEQKQKLDSIITKLKD